MPAPRYRIAWPISTKWVVGAASMMFCTSAGMLSRGVMPPDSIISGMMVSIINMPNCGMLRATVAMKIPIEVVANRHSAAPAKNSGSEPSIGTPIRPRTTRFTDSAEASSTTRPIDQILDSMISAGVTGITSRCSMVPCSRSRISAAPVRMIESMVTLLMIRISPPNQLFSSAGLKRARSARSTGNALPPRWRWTNSLTSPMTICCTAPLPEKAWLMRVASTLSCRSGARPASTSRWKPCGMYSAKVKRPSSMPGSIPDIGIISGTMNCGG